MNIEDYKRAFEAMQRYEELANRFAVLWEMVQGEGTICYVMEMMEHSFSIELSTCGTRNDVIFLSIPIPILFLSEDSQRNYVSGRLADEAMRAKRKRTAQEAGLRAVEIERAKDLLRQEGYEVS